MMLNGKIPKKIFYSKGIYKINNSYCGMDADSIANKDFGEPLKEKMPTYMSTPSTNRQFEHDNTKPIVNPKLIGFIHAYGATPSKRKSVFVVENNKQYYPMDIEVFFETIKNVAPMNKDNVLSAEYVFISFNREIKLVRTGSALYEKMVKNTELRNRPRVKQNELEVGRLYSSPAGNKAIFLGYATTIEYKPLGDNIFKCFKFEKIEHKKLSLWHEVPSFSDIKKYQEYFDKTSGKHFYTKLIKTHNYVQTLSHKIEVPKNIIRIISDQVYLQTKTSIENSKKKQLGIGSTSNTFSTFHFLGSSELTGTYHHEIFFGSKYFNMSLYGCHPSFGERKELIELARNK